MKKNPGRAERRRLFFSRRRKAESQDERIYQLSQIFEEVSGGIRDGYQNTRSRC